MLHIGVIGAGIVGLCSAINVQRAIPKAKVTIIADRFGPDTVSHGAGGLFRPDMSSMSGDKELLQKCLRDSWDFYSSLVMSESAFEAGQSFVYGFLASNVSKAADYEELRKLALYFQDVPKAEFERRNMPFTFGHTCKTVVSEPPKFLAWLMKQFRLNGGEIQRRTLSSISQLYGEFQLVINCCGLGAENLVGDKECFPVRGQLAMVKAPWIKSFFFSDLLYLIPHADKLVIGGIRDKGNYRDDVDPDTNDTLLKNAERLFPELKGAERLPGWAGLRPGRSELRLDVETLDIGHNRRLPVVHNYGHSGHGITLGWGSGVQAAKLAKATLTSIPRSSL